MVNIFLELANIHINYRISLNESFSDFAVSQLGSEATILRFTVCVKETVALDFGLVYDGEERSGTESRSTRLNARILRRILFGLEPLLFGRRILHVFGVISYGFCARIGHTSLGKGAVSKEAIAESWSEKLMGNMRSLGNWI